MHRRWLPGEFEVSGMGRGAARVEMQFKGAQVSAASAAVAWLFFFELGGKRFAYVPNPTEVGRPFCTPIPAIGAEAPGRLLLRQKQKRLLRPRTHSLGAKHARMNFLT
jgi:hypothetical protein